MSETFKVWEMKEADWLETGTDEKQNEKDNNKKRSVEKKKKKNKQYEMEITRKQA